MKQVSLILNTFTLIKNTVDDVDFKHKHRLSSTSFERSRKLSFSTLIRYFLNLNKGSYQQELDNYFAQVSGNLPSQVVTKSALSQARKNLSHRAFVDLNETVVDGYYAHNTHLKTWQGHRLCAIDGSQTRLPNEPDIVREFGTHPGKENQADCSLALASVYFDVLNRISIDASINPTNASERECAAVHLGQALPNDLTILDRGYNAFWLYSYFCAHDLAFCVRAKVNQNLACKAFVESGLSEQMIVFKPNKPSIEQCKSKRLSYQPITLRLVRVELGDEVEVLISNLLDTDTYPVTVFKELYHLRWGIEENYKRLKQWVEIENFSGRSALSIRQDFHAKILASNLASMLVNEAQIRVEKAVVSRRLSYQINFAQALSKMKNTIVQWLLLSLKRLRERIVKMIKYIACTVESVRPGRSYYRNKTKKNRLFYIAYKRAR